MTTHPCRRQVLAGLATVGTIAGVSGLGGCGASDDGPETGETLTPLDDVPVGASVTVTSEGGAPIVVSRPTAESVHAVSAICTHQGCEVAPVEDDPSVLLCPCHRSEFETFTGEVLRGPASEPLPEIPVEVRGGSVVAR